MTTQEARRPIPVPDVASGPFFEGAKQKKFMLQRCKACGAWHYPVRAICDACLSKDLEWAQASGKGEVYTFAYMHYVYHPGFAKDVPYNLTVVKLAEGPVMETNLVGVKRGEIKIGMPVEVTFEDAGDGVVIPKFKPSAKR
jgi:uncharacterized OB-fold protein